jgi:hypothetical protein
MKVFWLIARDLVKIPDVLAAFIRALISLMMEAASNVGKHLSDYTAKQDSHFHTRRHKNLVSHIHKYQ